MFKGLRIAAALIALAVVPASPALAKRIDSHEVNFGSVTVHWRDMMAISPMHKKAFPQPRGQSVYMFVALTKGKLSFDRFVALAEQAVQHEGKCQWLGYDKAFDQQFRAQGQMASQKDTRLFFAKLRCK